MEALPSTRLPKENNMRELIGNFDWSKTPVGPPDAWPQSLRTTISILLNSKFPMFLWWGADMIQFYNDAYRPSLGNNGKHPAALGQRGEDCWPEIWPTIKPLIDQVMAGGDATWSEDQLIPIYRNGKLEDVYWTYSYSLIADESGAPGGVLVTCMETTQKVLTLARLEESADELTFAIEATELATWDVNPKSNKLKGNKRLKEWFGLQADEEVELQSALDVIAEEDRSLVVAAIKRANEFSSGGKYDIEYRIISPVTSQERYVRAQGRAWFNENQEAYRFNGTLQDITTMVLARKRLEESEQKLQLIAEELAAANEELRVSNGQVREVNESLVSANIKLTHINEDMDSFIYAASHDLRSPISNIESLVDAIQEDLSVESRENPGIKHLFSLMFKSIERFKRTVRDLTEVTKLQREEASDEQGPVNLSHMLEEVQLDLSSQIEQAEAELDVNLESCELVSLSPKNVRSIIYNLLSNAIKYRAPSRRLFIQIKCHQQENYQVLSVQDNGLGMDLSDESKVFGMFKRLHDHVEGTGIGLYIVKKIVKNAGGKIEVSSKVGEGSTFRVYFPKKENA